MARLGNRIVRFGNCYELASTSILVCIFSPWALSCSAAASSEPPSELGFALSKIEVPLLGPVWSWLPSDPLVEDPCLGTHCLCFYPRAAAIFGEMGPSGLGLWTI
jgi:hypothetical protein